MAGEETPGHWHSRPYIVSKHPDFGGRDLSDIGGKRPASAGKCSSRFREGTWHSSKPTGMPAEVKAGSGQPTEPSVQPVEKLKKASSNQATVKPTSGKGAGRPPRSGSAASPTVSYEMVGKMPPCSISSSSREASRRKQCKPPVQGCALCSQKH
jgi:hypothetical protein